MQKTKTMSVRDLIDTLMLLEPSAEVYVASDTEGNAFHPIDGLGQGSRAQDVIIWPLHTYVEIQ